MKALTNILNYILLLMMILIASCTEDVAEVDDLVRGEEYVTVRMQVPGMKNATTRADEAEDNLTSVVVLVFRNDALVSKTEVTTASSTLTTTNTTGTFNIPRPKSEDVIHFLGNLPDAVKNNLPETGGSQTAVLCALTTTDDENLSYWGTATYTSGESINVTLYRNMAKIEIVAGEECTFPEDELFIVGLVNANQSGALVPYNEGFNFNLTNDYFTLPADVETETDTELSPAVTSLYVFEHDNPNAYTETNKDSFFCVICKIGKYYYKVALTSDGETPYDIIRNHKYTILVNDLDEGEPDYDAALKADPINLEIKVEKEVELQLIQEGIDESGNELKNTQEDIAINCHANSTEEVTIKVVVPIGVKTLTVTADGFTVTSGDAGDADDREMTSDGDNQYTIKETYREQENIVRFKLRLNNDVETKTTPTIKVSGEGVDEFTTVKETSITITVEPAEETEGTTWWQGEMVLDATDDETKIAIPKSYFFNGETPLIPVGSQILFAFENITGFLSDTEDDYRRIWMQAADPRDWSQVASQDFVYDGNRATLNVTQEVLDDILDTSDGEYDSNYALMIQGQGRILKKITLIRAKESIIATADKTQLYYDSDDSQVVTINVTVPDGVETLTIGGASNFAVKQGDITLTATEGVYSYTVTGNSNPIPFTFTLNPQNVTETQTITFSDPTESVNSAEVAITMAATPTVTFSPTGAQTITLGNPLNVVMAIPDDKELSDFRIEVTSESDLTDFAVAQNDNPLTLSDGVYSTTNVSGEQTFTFTPTATGEYTITFSGSGEGVNMPQESERTINLTVNAAAVTTMSATSGTINMDNSETSTTLTLTKPSGVNTLRINVSDGNAFDISTNANVTNQWTDNGNCYTISGNSETVDFTFTLKNGFNTAGEYTVTFSNYSDSQMSATATITIKKTPTVSFSNTSDKTLYWNDGSPTSFDVEMTGVPDGKDVTLSIIDAEAFTITLPNGETVSDTYIGGNTTFTIEPKDVNSVRDAAYSIGFSGTGDGVIVPNTSISVKVEATQPAVAEIVISNEEQKINWNKIEIVDNRISQNIGGVIKIDVVADGSSTQIQLWIPDYKYINDFSTGEQRTLEYPINSSFTTISISGTGFTIKKIYIIPAS